MTQNVDELVLDAFFVEHREHLEQLRTLAASLQHDEVVANDPRVRDAFRLAHSFKGGARVCGLHQAEQLSHCLESVLEQLDHGNLEFTRNVVTSVNLTLDTIEDWMVALESDLPLPDTSVALTAMQEVLNGPIEALTATAESSKRRSRLFSVFSQEYAQHSLRLRNLSDEWNSPNSAPDDDQITEATRLAHTLAGAAAIVDLPAVESAARQLENLLRAVLRKDDRLDAPTLERVSAALDTMANEMGEQGDVHSTRASSVDNRPLAAPAAVEPAATDNTACDTSSMPSLSNETVRVAVESLDQLMRSSSELSIDNQHVARLTRQISKFHTEISEFDREREILRRSALPGLHKLVALSEFAHVLHYLESIERQVSILARRTSALSVDHRRVAWQLQARSAKIQRDVHEARLVRAHDVFHGFRKMIRDLTKGERKEIDFEVSGLDVRADRMVLQALKDPIMHVLRNCVSHGVESPDERRLGGKPERGRVQMSLEIANGRLNISIVDDGRGIDVEQMRHEAVERGLFDDAAASQRSDDDIMRVALEPGFSTANSVTELAGRGMGLSIVHESVSRLQGQVALQQRAEAGLRVDISVPLFVSTHRVLLVACGEQVIAIPTQGIQQTLLVTAGAIDSVEGQPVIMHELQPVRIARLCDVLGQPTRFPDSSQKKTTSVVLLKMGARLLAVSVDSLIEVRDALILNLDEFAATNRIAGGIVLDDGQVALVVRASELFDAVVLSSSQTASAQSQPVRQVEPGRVLIVDDSFTTRTLEKSILETQGYSVSVAVDGVEALAQMRQQKFGLVISDVEMPRMDGFALLQQIKADRRLANTPVILVTSRDRHEDQQHGLDLGADAYIIKRKFDHQELLNTIRQLI